MPKPQGFPPLLWAVTVAGLLIFFLILRKMSSLKGVVAHGCVASLLVYTPESLIYNHYFNTHVTSSPRGPHPSTRPPDLSLLSPNILTL